MVKNNYYTQNLFFFKADIHAIVTEIYKFTKLDLLMRCLVKTYFSNARAYVYSKKHYVGINLAYLRKIICYYIEIFFVYY